MGNGQVELPGQLAGPEGGEPRRAGGDGLLLDLGRGFARLVIGARGRHSKPVPAVKPDGPWSWWRLSHLRTVVAKAWAAALIPK